MIHIYVFVTYCLNIELTPTMKNLRKFSILSALAGVMISCNQAPQADVQASEAQEVETADPTEISVTYIVDTEGDEIHWVGFKT
jgi:hypothetical protein